jgi:hypothetical protein
MANEQQGGAAAGGGGIGNPAPAGAPAGSPAPTQAAAPATAVSWAALLNIAALAVLLWFAIGATCEIVRRNEDYARVAAYQKFLLGCRSEAVSPDKDCPKKPDGTSDAEFWIKVSSDQVRRYTSLNALGAADRCHVSAVFASSVGHFWEDCLKVLSGDKELHTAGSKLALASILNPWPGTYSGWPLGFDERAKEPLYFLLVLAASGIGALIAGLRTAGITTHRDLALGIGAGFAIFLLLRGGNFVFFTGSVGTDILNPFTAAAVGLLVGLFNDKAFALLGKAMPDSLSPAASAAVQNATKAQTDAAAAIKKLQDDLAAAAGKGPQGLQQKELQDLATAALNAKAKADEAVKAQAEALKPQ